MSIKIVSDSTCDLSKDLIERYNISILPLHILLGEDEYNDGINITSDEIYAWSDANKTTPRTSAPSIEEAIELFRELTADGSEVISFSISSSMSASNNVMRLAAEELELEDTIHIVDSANLSTGIGHLVIEAATRAANGMSAKDILAELESLKPRVRASFVVDTLTYLHRGGRCSGLAALAGGALKLHPRIDVVDGKMGASKKYRGKMNHVIITYVKELAEELLKAKPDRVFITHSGCDEGLIQSVRQQLEALNYFEAIHVTRAGGVISSHCGPGTLGILYIA